MRTLSSWRWLVVLAVAALALAAGFAALRLLPGPPPPEPAVRVVWTFEPPERGAFLSSPVMAGDRVYVAAVQDRVAEPSGVVYALDWARGAVVWKFDAGGTMRQTYSSPCLDGGRLYLGEGMHGDHVCKLYCIDAESGRERWHAEASDHIESSPCVAGGKVFFGAGDDGVYCLDAATGKECWHFQAPVHVDASPALDGNRVYVGSGVTNTRKLARVFCLDRATGKELWRVATDLPVWGSPAPDHGRLFVPLGNGRLLERAAPPERPAGALLGLEAATGHQLWRHDVGDAVMARPAHDGRHVYFGSRDGSCYCLDHDGGLRWRADLGSPIVTRPAVLDGRLYVVPLGGQLACLEAATGRALWRFDLAVHSQASPQLVSSPVVGALGPGPAARRRVYFGTELKGPVSSAAVFYCLED
jgi:outer membrane protein assembly factor BamB